MEIADDADNSPTVIPESPPPTATTVTAPVAASSVELDDSRMDVEEDEDVEEKIEDFDDVVPDSQAPSQQRCDFNIVIDMDDSESSGENGLTNLPKSPSPKPTNAGTDTKEVIAKVVEVEGKPAPSDPYQDDPFASSEDDVAIMAQIEQLEKSLLEDLPADVNNSVLPIQMHEDYEESKPVTIDVLDYDLDASDERERKRTDELKTLKRLGPNERIFPDVRPSNFHTVAFSSLPDYQPGDELLPHPQVFHSRWEPDFVPMPRDRENLRVFKIRQQKDTPAASAGTSNNTEDESVQSPPTFVEKTVWLWQRIDQSLKVPILTCEDISACLKHYCRMSTELRSLSYAIESIMSTPEREHLFDKVLPFMQKLCLDFNLILTCPLPLLGKFWNYSISLSQKQIACLLANAFFSTFPKRLRDELQFPTINFVELFQCLDEDDNSRLITKAHKIRCILHYFTRIAEEMPQGVVTFTRRSIRNSKAPEWHNSTKKLTKIIPLSEGTIEDDGIGMLQVDFANKIVGGGVLGGGAVQEEILFVTYPELLISRLFTEKLTSCEALIVTGCERFSRYSGYARNFRFDGDFYDVTPKDSKGRKCSQIVAIDALYITRPITQFHPRFLTRELNKAYVGFSAPTATSVPVATGKWGCGAFNGNPQLKAILQLMAASQAGRDVVFFTFGDLVIQKEIEDMYSVIKDMTIQQVWNLLNQFHSLFCVTSQSKYTLCQFIKEFGCHPPPPPQNANSSTKSEQGSSKNLKEVPIAKFYTKEIKRKPQSKDTLENGDSSTSVKNGPTRILSSNEKNCGDGFEGLNEEQISLVLNQHEAASVVLASKPQGSVPMDSEPMEGSSPMQSHKSSNNFTEDDETDELNSKAPISKSYTLTDFYK